MVKILLEEMSWVEAAEALKQAKVALVPIGSTEQHGPHLPLIVDTACCAAVAKRVAEKMYPKALVAPYLPVGVSFHHMRFAGSLSIRENTLIEYAYDMAASFKHYGLDFVFFVNGHWGNKTPLAHATARIRRELGVRAMYLSYWDLYPKDKTNLIEDGEIPDHAGEFETAEIMHLRPDLVKKDWKRDPNAFTLDKRMYELLLTADDQFPLFGQTKDGIFYGNPAHATAEKGEKIIEYVSDEMVKFLDELLKTYGSAQQYTDNVAKA
jgi:creatinine amidohydrolase